MADTEFTELIRKTIHFSDGTKESHFVEEDSHLALCGVEVMEDLFEILKITDTYGLPISCADCLNIVRLCKKIKLLPEEKSQVQENVPTN